MTEGIAQAPGSDLITLTPAARLDLLMKSAETSVCDMDALLQATFGSVSDPTAMDMHDVSRLVQVARGVATAVEATRNATAIVVGKGLPGQAERVVVLITHASSSLQAVIVRLMQAQATAENTLMGDRVASLHNRDRANMAETMWPIDHAGCEPVSWIATNLLNPQTIAAALVTVQEIATRLARLRTTSPASGASSATPVCQRKKDAIWGGTDKIQRPVLARLFSVLVALVVLQRIDPGPVRHIAMMLALPMVLAWCGHWLARRRQNDARQQVSWWQDEVAPDSLGASMSITAGSGHATRAASLA